MTMLMMARPKRARHIIKYMKSKELEFSIKGMTSIAITRASPKMLRISCKTYFFGSNGKATYQINWKKIM